MSHPCFEECTQSLTNITLYLHENKLNEAGTALIALHRELENFPTSLYKINKMILNKHNKSDSAYQNICRQFHALRLSFDFKMAEKVLSDYEGSIAAQNPKELDAFIKRMRPILINLRANYQNAKNYRFHHNTTYENWEVRYNRVIERRECIRIKLFAYEENQVTSIMKSALSVNREGQTPRIVISSENQEQTPPPTHSPSPMSVSHRFFNRVAEHCEENNFSFFSKPPF